MSGEQLQFQKARRHEVAEQNMKERCCGAMAYGMLFLTICEVSSHLIIVNAAIFSTPFVLVVYFMLLYGRVSIVEGDCLSAWRNPLKMFKIIRPAHGQCVGALIMLSCMTLQMSVWFAMVARPGYYPTETFHWKTNTTDCESCSLPEWACPPGEKTHISCDDYSKCMEVLPWYWKGMCNVGVAPFRAAKGVALTKTIVSIIWTGLPLVSWFICVLRSLAMLMKALYMRCCGRDSHLEKDYTELDMNERAANTCYCIPPQVTVLLNIFHALVVDFGSDLNGGVQFILTHNPHFAAVTFAIMAKSLFEQLRDTSLTGLLGEVRESVSSGRMTDRLYEIILVERTSEAPLTLVLQYYGFMFVTISSFSIHSFVFSLLSSVYSVGKAAYDEFELNLCEHDAHNIHIPMPVNDE